MSTAGAFLVTPGAGADRNHHTLVALDEGLKVPVARVDFPYRKEGRKAPDRAPKAVAHVVDEARAVGEKQRLRANRRGLGGRSYGGRMCSMAVADGLPAAGLVLLSYPLHPPGKPEQPRVEHFPQLEVPCLFVSGTSDAFGSPDELESAAQAIAGPVTFAWLKGGHDPRNQDDAIVEIVGDWLRALR
jgi:predicted alpha/beta-hydrolase family hydrolase